MSSCFITVKPVGPTVRSFVSYQGAELINFIRTSSIQESSDHLFVICVQSEIPPFFSLLILETQKIVSSLVYFPP